MSYIPSRQYILDLAKKDATLTHVLEYWHRGEYTWEQAMMLAVWHLIKQRENHEYTARIEPLQLAESEAKYVKAMKEIEENPIFPFPKEWHRHQYGPSPEALKAASVAFMSTEPKRAALYTVGQRVCWADRSTKQRHSGPIKKVICSNPVLYVIDTYTVAEHEIDGIVADTSKLLAALQNAGELPSSLSASEQPTCCICATSDLMTCGCTCGAMRKEG